MTSFVIAAPENAGADAPDLAGPRRIGIAVLLAFFVVFGGWAVLASVATSAIAPGVVSVDSSRKVIQHLEGGIIGEIFVRNGDRVEAGDLLVRLDRTQAKATLDLLEGQLMAGQAREARMVAERDGAGEILFPEVLLSRADEPHISELMAGEKDVFAARRATLEGRAGILEKRLAQYDEEVIGLRAQIASKDRQLSLLDEEIIDVGGLIEKGLARKPRLLALERGRADIEGQRAENLARVATIEQGYSEMQLQIIELKTEMHDAVVSDLQIVQTEILDLMERTRAARDVLRRTEIRSPLAGTVVNQAIHTAGGVIAPGEVLMEVVPRDDTLIIEARLDPNDIDVVRRGLEARVRLSAFSQRNSQPVDAVVDDISADSMIDERTGVAYYLIRIRVTGDLTEAIGDEELYPGMQAEVMIVTGRTTLFDYLVNPLFRSFERAFR